VPDTPDWVMTRLQRRCLSRRHRLPQGRPRLLAARSPRATGLASSLFSCIDFAVRRRRFKRRPVSGGCPRFARQGASPSVFAPFALPLRMVAFWRGWLAQANTAVLVRSSNYDHGRSPRFHRRPKLPPVSHSASAEVYTSVTAVSDRCRPQGFRNRNYQRSCDLRRRSP
jgi:hypothetical protein